jgi:hypothetical protein
MHCYLSVLPLRFLFPDWTQSFVVEVSHQLKAINMPQFILYAVHAETVFPNVLREKCLYAKIRIYLSFLCMDIGQGYIVRYCTVCLWSL